MCEYIHILLQHEYEYLHIKLYRDMYKHDHRISTTLNQYRASTSNFFKEGESVDSSFYKPESNVKSMKAMIRSEFHTAWE